MSAFPIVEADPGVMRQVLSESPDLMVVSFRFERGAQGKPHSHPHVQSTYVRSGRFSFSVGNTMKEVGPGDSFIIESGLVHGCECLEEGELIDTFTPRRDDFLE